MYSENIELVLMEFGDSVDKAIDHLSQELLQIRAGRANPKIVERVMVDYYGTMTPIGQMATISVPEARMVCVSVWDQSQVKNVVKAITDANLGLNPSDDGKVIRLIFPQLTEERRKDLVKEVKRLAEQCKVSARNARRDAIDAFREMKKSSEITEDELSALEKDVQTRLDKSTEKVDSICAAKEKDIMEV